MTQTRTAIVTGGSRGIGAAIGRRLAADGIAVIVNYAHGRDEAEAVVADITAAGGRAVAIAADLSARDGAARLFDAAEAALGAIDILVNNAGVMTLAPIAEMDDDVYERHVALNLGGSFRAMRAAARRLRDGGRIINFSSSVVGLNQPGYGVYAATKAAVETLTRVLAKEVGARGITVNAVAPGPVATALFLDDKSEEQVAAIARMNPVGRIGEPDDIARVVALLAGADAQWINGQVVRANGGMV
ncbi:SDR family oxidoreductase [Sphingomonas sp. BK235]|uniref:SDR family oxidoreductase n=1 Tax=Sphingomonas sp. BK235 TaxID=2512131 RepID=UPI001050FAD7|nr:SDR family oxidoreductase [Sphingomonas sp. BK235]TCP34228.1 3-oxoacyl-[acyl-carrier protein] reductase [Sphingomonas sp. BK235]